MSPTSCHVYFDGTDIAFCGFINWGEENVEFKRQSAGLGKEHTPKQTVRPHSHWKEDRDPAEQIRSWHVQQRSVSSENMRHRLRYMLQTYTLTSNWLQLNVRLWHGTLKLWHSTGWLFHGLKSGVGTGWRLAQSNFLCANADNQIVLPCAMTPYG